MIKKLITKAATIFLAATFAFDLAGCTGAGSDDIKPAQNIPEEYKDKESIQRNKGIFARFTYMNWGITDGSDAWLSTEFIVGYDQILTRRERNLVDGHEFVDENSEKMNDQDFARLKEYSLELGDDDSSQGCDGVAWEAAVFDTDGKCVRYMPGGFIDGKPMQTKIVPIISRYAQIDEFTNMASVTKLDIDKNDHDMLMTFTYYNKGEIYVDGDLFCDGRLYIRKYLTYPPNVEYELTEEQFDEFQYHMHCFAHDEQVDKDQQVAWMEVSIMDPATDVKGDYVVRAGEIHSVAENFDWLIYEICSQNEKKMNTTPGVLQNSEG